MHQDVCGESGGYIDHAGRVYSAIEHKGDVAKAFGPSFVKRGDGEHFESVFTIG